MSISLVAVFLPILLMGSIIGRLFREFAVTLSMAVAISLFISLTATPMMCSRFLPNRAGPFQRLVLSGDRARSSTRCRILPPHARVALRHSADRRADADRDPSA